MIADTLLKLIQNYFDGQYYGNVNLLSHVFHPHGHYVNATQYPPLVLDIPACLAQVKQDASPASQNPLRRDRIVEVKRVGGNMAVATVESLLGAQYFQDVLTLIYVDGQWRIISKVSSHVPASAVDQAITTPRLHTGSGLTGDDGSASAEAGAPAAEAA